MQAAILGGRPTNDVDTPIAAVLIACFIALAATHMTIHLSNKRQFNRFFRPTLMTFGFCMTRIVALILRIVWANRPHSKNITIAATVFASAGVLLLFVINLIYAHRVWLGYQSRSRTHLVGPAMWILRGLIFMVISIMIIVITFTIISFLTTNPDLLHKARTAQRVGGTVMAVIAFLPLPTVLLSAALPHPAGYKLFGAGKMPTKLVVVAIAATLLSLGASFRSGTSFLPRPAGQPAWYHHKACLYVFNYGLEMMVVVLFAVSRADRLFYIEDEVSKPVAGSEETLAVAEVEKTQT